MEELLYEHKRFGFEFRVYRGRVEIRRPRLFGNPKVEVYLAREMVGAKTEGVGDTTLTVMFRDGKEKSWRIGADAPNALIAVVKVLA
jgi:hypothetical protein